VEVVGGSVEELHEVMGGELGDNVESVFAGNVQLVVSHGG
jgi:hypothetical protein